MSQSVILGIPTVIWGVIAGGIAALVFCLLVDYLPRRKFKIWEREQNSVPKALPLLVVITAKNLSAPVDPDGGSCHSVTPDVPKDEIHKKV